MSLPPVNFAPRAAAAVAVALSRSEHLLFAREAAAPCRRSWPPCPSGSSRSVRLAGKCLASYNDKGCCLVVKLPCERDAELVDQGRGDPFAPAGKVSASG